MTKRNLRVMLAFAASVTAVASVVLAADLTVRGRRMVVRQSPDAGATKRRIVVVGRELSSGITSFDSPLQAGATLRVFATPAQTHFFELPGTGWHAIPGGYRYVEPNASGRAIRRVVLNATGGKIRVVLRGDSTNLFVAPPNPGESGGIVLGLAFGNNYCVQLGGDAGGTIAANTANVFRIVAATSEPACPPIPTPLVPTPNPCDTNCSTPTPTPDPTPIFCEAVCLATPEASPPPPTATPAPCGTMCTPTPPPTPTPTPCPTVCVM